MRETEHSPSTLMNRDADQSNPQPGASSRRPLRIPQHQIQRGPYTEGHSGGSLVHLAQPTAKRCGRLSQSFSTLAFVQPRLNPAQVVDVQEATRPTTI